MQPKYNSLTLLISLKYVYAFFARTSCFLFSLCIYLYIICSFIEFIVYPLEVCEKKILPATKWHNGVIAIFRKILNLKINTKNQMFTHSRISIVKIKFITKFVWQLFFLLQKNLKSILRVHLLVTCFALQLLNARTFLL